MLKFKNKLLTLKSFTMRKKNKKKVEFDFDHYKQVSAILAKKWLSELRS